MNKDVKSGFAHLCVHSDYSIADGLNNVRDIVDYCISQGMRAVAITDHQTMGGIFKLFKYAKEINKGITDSKLKFKPIAGIDLETTDYGRLTLLAKNIVGYRNLCKIVSLTSYSPDEPAGRIIYGNTAGIICLTDNLDEDVITDLRYTFEENNLYLKLNGSNKSFYDSVEGVDKFCINNWLISPVATNNVHFTAKEKSEAHKRLIETGRSKHKEKYSGSEYLATEDEMHSMFSDIPEAVENAAYIANSIEFYDIENEVMPPLPSEFSTLRQRIWHGAVKRYGENYDDAIQERIDIEWELIENGGLYFYFTMFADLMDVAKKRIWAVAGPLWSTATCSIVNYCLGITDIDPLKYNLDYNLFFHDGTCGFSNGGFSLYVDEQGAREMFAYLMGKYGQWNVAKVGFYGTYGPKFSKSVMNEMAGEIQGNVLELASTFSMVAIGRRELWNLIPLASVTDYHSGGREMVTAYTASEVQKTGAMIISLLYTKDLTVMRACLNRIYQEFNFKLDIETIPMDDTGVFETFQNADTDDVWVFGLESSKKILSVMKPASLLELADVIDKSYGKNVTPKIHAQSLSSAIVAYRLAYLKTYYNLIFTECCRKPIPGFEPERIINDAISRK